MPSRRPEIPSIDLAAFLNHVGFAPPPIPASATQGGARGSAGQAPGSNGHAGNGKANGHELGATESTSTEDATEDTTDRLLADEWGKAYLFYRAGLYLQEKSGAVSGDGGHDRTFDAACVLIKGFHLTIAEARPILREWNKGCVPPWSDTELEHKLEDSDRKPDNKPRGYIRGALIREAQATEAGQATQEGGLPGHGSQAPTGGLPIPPGTEDNPHRLARIFLNEKYRHPDGLALRFWREDFHVWDGSAYRLVPAKETRAVVTLAISEEFDRIYHQALMRHGMRKKRATEGANGTGSGSDEASKGPPRPIPVTTKLVNDVLQALTSLSLICVSNVADQPAWIDGETGWPVDEVLPCRNALVHLPAFVAGLPCSRSPTPRFFGGYALGYDFDRHPREPTAWLDFLRQLWPDDQESIRTLQEWMGYLLTPDTSQQKMLMMIGPKRSGKGTIARIIKALIGANNVVNPTLSGLGQRFGTEPLIGKPVAIIGDARLTGRTDIGAVVEILLTVSGEDDQTIDRKHKGAITTKLPTRFMLLSNELPRMKDPSGAIVGRMVMLKLVNSFYGQEDIYLFRKLTKELPGILAWAIHGWNRLRERGYFVQPESGMEHIRTLEDLSSPIKTFIDVCCVIGSEYTVPISELFNTWKNWCSLRGRENVGDEAEFGRNLHAAIPNLETKYPRDGARRVRTYKGITLCSKQEEYTGKENKNDLGI